MVAVADTKLVTVTINDVELKVPEGELIVETVKRLGLEIPIFCYHPRMKPVGMCRMCLVEVGFKQPDGSVRKMPKPQTGCTLPASNGLVVITDSEMVHRDRKGVLEFLLINHPLDCPICDRGGECPLQNNTIHYGPSTSRYVEMKRHLPKAYPLSEFVTLDLERCIHCGRCVRFTEEISGDSQLAFRFRGASMQPSTFQLTDFESKFSGNVIEICPVGALTSSKYRFRARPWDLETRPGICTVTNSGANMWFDFRAGKFVRVRGRTNEAVNEEWLSDRSMFGHDFYNSPERLTLVALRRGDQLVPTTWADAHAAILEAFQGEVGLLMKPNFSNEGLYMGTKLFREAFGSEHVDTRWSTRLLTPEQELEPRLGVAPVQTRIADLESKRAILVFGCSLADSADMAYLRVRKAWFQNEAKVISATPAPTEVDRFAAVSLHYRPGTEGVLAAGLLRLTAKPPTPALERFTPEFVEQQTGVSARALMDAAEILRGASGEVAILTMRSLLEAAQGQAAVDALVALAHSVEGEFNQYADGVNEQGAREVGALPGPGGLDTRGILQAAADGKLQALWLVGADPLRDFPDRALAERALENVPFLVVQDVLESEAMHYASVVLPMAAPAEQDGSYTNFERRVQRMGQILTPRGESKPAWRVFSECLVRAKPQTPAFGAREVMEAIARDIPVFAEARYELLPEEGAPLPRTAPAEPKMGPIEESLRGL